jgi:hypothetical protein
VAIAGPKDSFIHIRFPKILFFRVTKGIFVGLFVGWSDPPNARVLNILELALSFINVCALYYQITTKFL